MLPVRVPAWAALVLWVAGCARGPAARTTPLPIASADTVARDSMLRVGSLPPVPEVRGPLALRVVYPTAGAVVAARDSSFLFGSTGTGDARLTINGRPVQVWPNGAWLAWVSLPPDSLMQFRIEARTDSAQQTLDHVVRRADYRPPPVAPVWIDTMSLSPRGSLWWPRDEYLALSVRASEGALLRMRLPDGTIVPLTPAPVREPVPGSVRAFDHDPTKLSTPIVRERYVGVLRGRAVGPNPGLVFPLPTAPVVATARGGHAGHLWFGPLRQVAFGPTRLGLPRPGFPVGRRRGHSRRRHHARALAAPAGVARFAAAGGGADDARDSDSVIVGRALPEGTYHWFFPVGTRAAVGRHAPTTTFGCSSRHRPRPGSRSRMRIAHTSPRSPPLSSAR